MIMIFYPATGWAYWKPFIVLYWYTCKLEFEMIELKMSTDFAGPEGPVVLVIMDGIGIVKNPESKSTELVKAYLELLKSTNFNYTDRVDSFLLEKVYH